MLRRAVPIQLDRTRNLRFDMKAKANIQTSLGKPVNKVFENIGEIGEYELLVILTYGLMHEDKTLNEEKVSNILYECSLSDDEIVLKLFEAFAESNGMGDEFRRTMEETKEQENAEKNQ